MDNQIAKEILEELRKMNSKLDEINRQCENTAIANSYLAWRKMDNFGIKAQYQLHNLWYDPLSNRYDNSDY